MLTRPLFVCLLISLASAPWMADAASKTAPATSTWTRTTVKFFGRPCVTNRTVRSVARPAPPMSARRPSVVRTTPTWVRKASAPQPPKAPVAKAAPKPVQGSLQLHPPSTGVVVRMAPARVTPPPFRLLVMKPISSPPRPRPEPTPSSDFKFGPKGLSRQIDRDWSMSFSAALSPSPSTSAQSHPASQWDRVMPVIKLEKTF